MILKQIIFQNLRTKTSRNISNLPRMEKGTGHATMQTRIVTAWKRKILIIKISDKSYPVLFLRAASMTEQTYVHPHLHYFPLLCSAVLSLVLPSFYNYMNAVWWKLLLHWTQTSNGLHDWRHKHRDSAGMIKDQGFWMSFPITTTKTKVHESNWKQAGTNMLLHRYPYLSNSWYLQNLIHQSPCLSSRSTW